jgi:hypothetical protein
MANVTKSTSGNVTTYTITDGAGVAGTIAVTAGPVTGNTTTIAVTAGHNDWLQMAAELLLQLETGVLPGSGAQGLVP